MQVPIRVSGLLRPAVPFGVLLAVGFSTIVFGATPFLLTLITDEYGVSLVAASLIGVAQLSGFVVGSWGAGRLLQPRRRVFVSALTLALVANLISALLPPFWLLVALRFASGLALGLIAWFGWVQVFGEKKGMADIAVMGPLAGIAAGPLVATFAVGGPAGVFLLLAVAAAIPLVLNRGTVDRGTNVQREDRSTAVREAVIILVALGIFTLGGSAVFQYAVLIGTENAGLSVGTVAIIFSANAVAGIPSARWPWSRGRPGLWFVLISCCALGLTLTSSGVVFAASVITWGFCFWMATPGVFSVLADRSVNPADRAGDAQAVMAVGRIFGPLLGASLLEPFGAATLGLVGGGLMLTAGVMVLLVELVVPPRDRVLTS